MFLVFLFLLKKFMKREEREGGRERGEEDEGGKEGGKETENCIEVK